MLRAAILHECQNYLGGGGGLGGSEKNIFLAPPPTPRAIIPDARRLGTFENQDTRDGVGILFNNNFNLNVIKTLQDPNGRFIICDIEADGKLLTLANIYAWPNKDDPNFFDTFFDRLSCFKCDGECGNRR